MFSPGKGETVNTNFLLDEHMSPRLAPKFADKGLLAQCVAHLGLAGKPDPTIWRYAYEHDQIVITANARDYLTLAAGSDLHAGLILLRAHGLSAEEQWQHIEPVLNHARNRKLDLVNHVVEVWDVDRFDIRPLPAP